jgi:hypothetical protein
LLPSFFDGGSFFNAREMDEAENFRGEAGSFHQQTLSVAMASAAKIFRSW